MECFSINYKKTPVEIRQKFAFTQKQQESILLELVQKNIIESGVLVSTCNRSELYFYGKEKGSEGVAMQALLHYLANVCGVSKEELKKYGMFFYHKKACKHLFLVACGLDSMVLGEDEILHQLKDAYQLASRLKVVDARLNILFQDAFHCAKLAKSSTELSSTPLSIGTLTANLIEDFLENNETPKKVMVIGASGNIGSIVAKNLLDKQIEVLGTTRNKKHAVSINLVDERVLWKKYEERYAYIKDVAVVVSATASPHYTITKDSFLQYKRNEVPYLLIDLAVPFDIDFDVTECEQVSRLDIDYFKNLSYENQQTRLSEAEKVKEYARNALEDTLKKLYLRDMQPLIGSRMADKSFRDTITKLQNELDSDTFQTVLFAMVK